MSAIAIAAPGLPPAERGPAPGLPDDRLPDDRLPDDRLPADGSLADGSLAEASVIAPLFARMLGRSTVGEDEDFFDLGGDSILATALMLEIERATGRHLSVTLLYDAPTPAAMARLLAAGDGQPAAASSRLVLLRAGAAPALFMPHGLLGIVTDLYDFAQRLDTTQAVYGIQAIGDAPKGAAEDTGTAEGTDAAPPRDRVEAMARAYVDDIRRIQPDGPYLLAGYCFGGLIALEMAQTLRQHGERVALLALLDTHPHSKHWPWRYRAASWLRLARSQIAGRTLRNMTRYLAERVRGLPPAERVHYLATRLAHGLVVPFSLFRLSVMLHRFELADGTPARPRAAHPASVHRMTAINVRAFEAYRPSRYDGEVVLLQTLARKRVQFDGRSVWSDLLSRLKIGTVSAHDWETVGKLVAYFADPLSQCLRTALARAPSRQNER